MQNPISWLIHRPPKHPSTTHLRFLHCIIRWSPLLSLIFCSAIILAISWLTKLTSLSFGLQGTSWCIICISCIFPFWMSSRPLSIQFRGYYSDFHWVSPIYQCYSGTRLSPWSILRTGSSASLRIIIFIPLLPVLLLIRSFLLTHSDLFRYSNWLFEGIYPYMSDQSSCPFIVLIHIWLILNWREC